MFWMIWLILGGITAVWTLHLMRQQANVDWVQLGGVVLASLIAGGAGFLMLVIYLLAEYFANGPRPETGLHKIALKKYPKDPPPTEEERINRILADFKDKTDGFSG